MTTTVDWAAIERRGRRLQWWALPAYPLLVVAYGTAAGWEDLLGGALLWGAAAVALLGAAALVLVGRRPRRRARTAEAQRIQHALQHHLDPGPELRERADRQARTFARTPWLGATYPLLAGTLALSADWSHPARTGIALAVVTGLFLALSVWWTRQARAARRWLADPPGRTQPLPPANSVMAWRWLGVAAVSCLGLGLVLGVVAALLD